MIVIKPDMSQTTQSLILDPVSVTNLNRTTKRFLFRLPNNQIYLPSLLLSDIFAKAPDEGRKYRNPRLGLLSLVKSARLLIDGVEADHVQDVDRLLGFQLNRKSNGQETDLVTNIAGTSMGYTAFQSAIKGPGDMTEDSIATNARGIGICQSDEPSEERKAFLDLQSVFGFLSSRPLLGQKPVPVIHTGVMQNVEVIIDMSGEEVFYKWEYSPGTLIPTFFPVAAERVEIETPVLICEQIMDDRMYANLQRQFEESTAAANSGVEFVPFFSFVRDQVYVPEVQGNIFQPGESNENQITAGPFAFRFNGFQGRFLQKLLLVSDLNAQNTTMRAGSSSRWAEKMVLTVNGRRLFPFSGIDTDARKIGICANTWGDFSATTPSVVNQHDPTFFMPTEDTSLKVLAESNTRSYFGCSIGQMIDTLDFTIQFKPGQALNWAVTDEDAFYITAYGQIYRSAKLARLPSGRFRLALSTVSV